MDKGVADVFDNVLVAADAVQADVVQAALLNLLAAAHDNQRHAGPVARDVRVAKRRCVPCHCIGLKRKTRSKRKEEEEEEKEEEETRQS